MGKAMLGLGLNITDIAVKQDKFWFTNLALALNGNYPSLIYDFANNRYYNTADGVRSFPFSAVRTTNATMFDSAGRLVWAPANMCINSTPGATGWTAAGAGTTCSTTGSTTPCGGAEAKLIAGSGLTLNANDGTGGVGLSVNPTVVSGNTLVYSFDARAGEITSVRLREPISTGARIIVSLIDGSIAVENGSNSITAGILVTASDLGSGWWRIIAKRTVTTTTFDLDIKPGGTTGDGVSGLYIGSVQIELNDETAPKAFNPTSGTAYYGPRFDYAPNAGAARGLRVEDAATNDIASSQTIGAVGFGSSSTGASYLGGWVSSRYTADGTANNHFFSSGSVTPTAAQVRRVQAFIKIVTGTRIQLSTSTQHAPAGAYINVNSGSIVATGADASNTFCIDCGDGLYWMGFTYTAIGAPLAGGGVVCFAIATDADTRGPIVTSSDVFDVLFMMNAAGSGLTSPILTTGVAVTRGEETFDTVTAAWLDQTQGTLYANYIPGNSTDQLRRIVCISDGTTSNRYEIGSTVTRTFQSPSASAGVSNFAPTTVNAATAFADTKGVAKFLTPYKTICLNGGTVATSSAAAFPASGYNDFDLGPATGSGMRLNGWLKEVRYYPDASASNAQLQTLTT